MTHKASIWTIEGRAERTGQRLSERALTKLKKKREGQLERLIEKYKKTIMKKCRRWEDKLCH